MAELTRDELRAMAPHHPTAWAMYASGGDWQNARHFDHLADRVMEMRAGKLKRLCVSMPPGSGKSEFLSLYVASWWLATRPKDRVVIASYGKSLCVGWAERARNLLTEHGPEVFGVHVNYRQKAEFWQPRDADGKPLGGYLFAVGRGGALTGKRAELLIVDDLLKDAQEANSEATRAAAWDWFDRVAMTRLMPSTCVVMIATRWHAMDPIGMLESKQAAGEVDEPWTFVNFPAISDSDDDPLGRAPGEALWPEMWPIDELRKLERGRDRYTWAALYQGRPTPDGGGMFQREFFRYFTEESGQLVPPDGQHVARSNLVQFATLDLAYSTKTSADYTVCCVWGADRQACLLYLLHVERERVGAEQLAHWIRVVFARHQIRVGYVERSGFYADITRYLIMGARLPLKEIQPNTDKVSRAQPAAALMASGGLLFPAAAPWLDDLQDELLIFPAGAHDDQVDALSFGVYVAQRLRGGGASGGGGGASGGGYKARKAKTWKVGR